MKQKQALCISPSDSPSLPPDKVEQIHKITCKYICLFSWKGAQNWYSLLKEQNYLLKKREREDKNSIQYSIQCSYRFEDTFFFYLCTFYLLRGHRPRLCMYFTQVTAIGQLLGVSPFFSAHLTPRQSDLVASTFNL